MTHFRRGIAPELLISQVKNTMPYLFGESGLEAFPPAQVLRQAAQELPELLSHFDYFKLCMSAHYLTVATPVPTDVDNQIRQKLWPEQLPLGTALEMADLVLESRAWDFTEVSRRWVRAVVDGYAIVGHKGEWFTVATGAYCALKQYKKPAAAQKAQEIVDAVSDEVKLHSEAFGSLWRARDGLACLKGAAAIAHNFGDLDRVLDMWELSPVDPFHLEFYKLATLPFDSNRKLRHLGRLWVAGELYKSEIGGSSMALENHRHFALRKPRALRSSPDLMITIGPFFDGWGKQVAGQLAEPDLLEVVEALRHGWERLPRTVGYGRALRGISDARPGLVIEGLPAESQAQFEKKWADQAIALMDEIPSRA